MQLIDASDLFYRLFLLVGITSSSEIDIVSREGWHALPPVLIEPMPNPVPYVIIHHSYIPPACNTSTECIEAMQFMQDLHMNTNGWNDIGYSFAVGGDGRAYTGRGWSSVGAHAPLYNNKSIGICIIGDWREELPPENQLETVHNLIQLGVDSGYIRPDYILYGHRQVRVNTECPGDRLFEEIHNWPHFSTEVDVFYNDTIKKSCARININIEPRSAWHARTALKVEPMPNPVPYVIIHHSHSPPACNTTPECIKAMQYMQDMHMDIHGWNDIGYSFAVGGDGNVYTGRGWSAVGAHAPLYNNQSIGICIIGDWMDELPPKIQLQPVHNLIQLGVDSGYIRPDYILHGHRQVRVNTKCPGDRLFEEIKTWPHFSNHVRFFYNNATI